MINPKLIRCIRLSKLDKANRAALEELVEKSNSTDYALEKMISQVEEEVKDVFAQLNVPFVEPSPAPLPDTLARKTPKKGGEAVERQDVSQGAQERGDKASRAEEGGKAEEQLSEKLEAAPKVAPAAGMPPTMATVREVFDMSGEQFATLKGFNRLNLRIATSGLSLEDAVEISQYARELNRLANEEQRRLEKRLATEGMTPELQRQIELMGSGKAQFFNEMIDTLVGGPNTQNDVFQKMFPDWKAPYTLEKIQARERELPPRSFNKKETLEGYNKWLKGVDSKIEAIEELAYGTKPYEAEIRKQAKALGIEEDGKGIENLRLAVLTKYEAQKEDGLAALANNLRVDMDTAWEMANGFDPGAPINLEAQQDKVEDIPTPPAPSPISEKETPDVWTMPEDALQALVNGAYEVLEDSRGEYTFETYEQFKSYMDARYVERDYDGMELAFREADGKWKTKYLRDNASESAHKRAWISSLLTNTPLPATDPPKPRTTPRPTAKGEDPTPKKPKKGPEPPTPREDFPSDPGDPSPYAKFDVLALVQLLNDFGNAPVTLKRLKDAWGRYSWTAGEILPFMNDIQLLSELFANPRLALRVLAHEAGHFFDLGTRPEGRTVKTGKSKEFWQKFVGLNILADDLAGTSDISRENQKKLLDEALSLTAEWRGPWDSKDDADNKYRTDPRELFADYISAMLVNPGFVKKHYPFLHNHFETLLNNKSEFGRSYRLMQEYLSADKVDQRAENRMEKAVQDTVEAMGAEKKKESRSWLDILRGGFVTKYGRARDIEKQPGIADTLVDKLELVHTWGMTQDALTADTLNKEMVPELWKLAGIEPDFIMSARNLLSGRAPRYSRKQQAKMEWALAELHKYQVWNRIIWERRASGRWIEENAVEAREVLKTVLAASEKLAGMWQGRLDAARDDQLYDLAAMIFLDINARGLTDVFANVIDGMEEDLDVKGQAILQAFNVRGKLLNPEGFDEASAARLLKKQWDRMTAEQRKALRAASAALKREIYGTQLKAYREGLINPYVWNEIIQGNMDSYVPFAVLDYFDGQVAAGVLPQKGTAKTVADTTIAAQLKISALNRWRQRQRQVALIKKMYDRGGGRVTMRKIKKASDIEKIRGANTKDSISRGVLFVRGKPYLVEFHGDRGKELEQAMRNENVFGKLEKLALLGEWGHQIMQLFTSFTSSFMFVSNPIRGMRTFIARIGLLKFLQVSNPFSGILWDSMRLGFNYANAAKGGNMDPVIRELVASEAISGPRMAGNMLRDVENMTDLMAAGSAFVNQLHRLGSDVRRPATTPLQKAWDAMTWLPRQLGRFTAMPLLRRLQWLFTIYEGFEKIQTYKGAQMRWATKKNLVEGLTRRGGIPKPGVGGYWSMPMEFFVPWLRVALQGIRATWELLRDANTRAGFATRLFLTEGVPRFYRFALATGMTAGLLRYLLHDDEDPEDTVMAEVMRRISPYKLATQDVIPMWFYDPRTGEYDLIATSDYRSGSEIPEHIEIVSWRIPASEEGRTFGPLLWNMLVQMAPEKEQLERPGTNPMQEAYRWATNYLLPGFSPALETGKGLTDMLLKGENPDDPYTGYPSANPQYFNAGWGNGREQAILGYLANQLGGPGYLGGQVAAMTGLIDRDVLKTLKLRDFTEKKDPWYLKDPTGTLRAVVAHDNYKKFRERKLSRMEETKIRAMSKQIMPREVKDMYEYYWRNRDRVKDMDPAEYGKYRAASQFVSKVWGKLDDPDSYYNKAASAMTQGSKQNKETVRRDLAFAAGPWLALFKNPKANRISTVLHLSDSKTARKALTPAQHQVYELRRQEIQQNYYDRLRNSPKWSGLSADDQRDYKLEANQLAREHAAKYLIDNPQLWRGK
jgi:hypothetical protein